LSAKALAKEDWRRRVGEIRLREMDILTEAAKQLRKRQTEAEKRLWFKLRDKQLKDVKFRRQVPIGNYIVDFVSFEKKLIIEIDGNPHRETQTRVNDTQRSLWLQEQGFKVLRFWNSEIENNLDKVVRKIKDTLKL
jgi:very-short-patch-repair endonuclease